MNTELTRRLDVDNASLFARCCLDTHLFVYLDSCFWVRVSDAKIKKLSWTAELIVPCGVVT